MEELNIKRMHIEQIRFEFGLSQAVGEARHPEESEPGVPTLFERAQELAGDDGDAVVSVAGYSAALEAGYMVAVDARITPELADEGLARELAHRIQNLRKSARFEITDRIVTFYDGPDDVARVMAVHGDYIKQETLSEDLIGSLPEDAANSETAQIEGMDVTLGVRRLNAA